VRSRPQFELRVGGRRVRLGERTLVMGVLNVTPDSFSDGGRYLDSARAIEHGLELARRGADWIDVGGESTRPGSKPVTAEEELERILPVISGLRRRLPRSRGKLAADPVAISIDTTKAEVAEAAVAAGAAVINDVSGLRFDPRLADVAARYGTPLVLMHLRGRPKTMQQRPFARSIWRSIRAGFAASIHRALARGVRRSQLILDPGLGFGKTRRQNFEILAGLERLRSYRLPILVGSSRKSFVRAIVAGEEVGERSALPSQRAGRSPALPLERAGKRSVLAREGHALPYNGRGRALPYSRLCSGDAAAVAAAILRGAHIVRVHDVAAVLPAVRIADAILSAAV